MHSHTIPECFHYLCALESTRPAANDNAPVKLSVSDMMMRAFVSIIEQLITRGRL